MVHPTKHRGSRARAEHGAGATLVVATSEVGDRGVGRVYNHNHNHNRYESDTLIRFGLYLRYTLRSRVPQSGPLTAAGPVLAVSGSV